MSTTNVLRTVISTKNPAKYYVGEDETIKFGGFVLTLAQHRFMTRDEDHPIYTGEIGEVEIITLGAASLTRIASSLTPIPDKLPGMTRPPYRNNSQRTTIRNFTRYNVYSVDRNGIKTMDVPHIAPHPYMKNEHQNCVVVRQEYFYETARAAKESLKLMKATPNMKGIVANKLAIKLEESQNTCSLGCCVMIDYAIHETKLLDLVTLYHANTDRVISITDAPDKLVHPCSPDYVPAPLLNGPIGDTDMFSTFRYVSRDPLAQTLYVRVAGQVLKLRPSGASGELVFPDNINENGEVPYYDEYILVNMQLSNLQTAKLAAPGTSSPIDVPYRPYVIPVGDGMEKFGIFRTEADASKEFADYSLKERKSEETILQLRADLSRSKRENIDLVRENAEATRKLEDKVSELKDDIRRMTIRHNDEIVRKDEVADELRKSNHKEIEELKEKREQSSHKSKTFHDYVKIFFGIVAGVLSLLPLYFKFRASVPV
jgi:hypothetical protein